MKAVKSDTTYGIEPMVRVHLHRPTAQDLMAFHSFLFEKGIKGFNMYGKRGHYSEYFEMADYHVIKRWLGDRFPQGLDYVTPGTPDVG